jgi:hypothetical protein
MNFQQFRLAYHSFLWTLKICIILAFILWTKNSFAYFQQAKFFDLLSDINQIEKNLGLIWGITKVWLITTGWFIFKIMIIKIIGWATKNFPVLPKWLIYWDNQGEISPVFGRELTRHFRHSRKINFITLIYLHSYSEGQLGLLKMHNNNPYTQQIFKKYDPHFERDISEENK